MKKIFLKSLILTALISTVLSIRAFAAVDGYVLKDNTEIVYQYDLKELKDSLINNTLGSKDPLFNEFEAKLNTAKLDLIHDSEGKYVSYEEVKAILLNKTLNNEKFDLDNEVKNSKASEVPAIIETIKKENGSIAKELLVLKEGAVIEGNKIVKDKYKTIHIKANNVTLSNLDMSGEIIIDPGSLGKVTIENVKCGNVNILSGDKKGIVFNKVESKEVKIDDKLGIEVQYKDKNSGTTGGSTGSGGSSGGSVGGGGNSGTDEINKKNMLTKARSELNQILSLVQTDKEKQVVTKIIDGITKAANDSSYDYATDVEETKALYNTLTANEKADLKDKIMKNVDILNLYALMSSYGLELEL